ncbi:unnamed protein product [Bursaphelenchus xylophilus]|uniref:(pine wood nematode) hypothetical protein n=1 Tax=Bursaphelenchus xylophilus TaxID=6326 RepID=A0A1I7SRA8_BURXY|nr:unnamed protein product [Bursaphelenchus xylophilus]CAG9111058.1 unnamed protein product [Bursaphelenchus xylophilus]
MHADYSPVLILLLLDYAISAFIKLGVTDLGFAQYCTMLRFGTDRKRQQLDVSLNTPEISVLDADCNNTYGKCQKFCQNDEFCHLFCSPMCCINPETRSKQCAGNRASDYMHNSTSFKVLNEYWTSAEDHASGIWVEDEVHVGDVDPEVETSAGKITFALKVVNSLYLDPDAIRRGDLGFGRHPTKRSIVQVIYDKGIIDRPVLTIAYHLRYSPYYILGEHSESYCGAEKHKVQALGNREWMFDAISATFLNFKSHRRKFRMILSSDGVIVNVSYFLLPPSNKTVFPASAVDPNPDGVEWIVGRMIYLNYCAFFDYDENSISFSKLTPDW